MRDKKIKLDGRDRRIYPRVARTIGLGLRPLSDGEDKAFGGESIDLSLGGLAVRVPRRLPTGSRLYIDFPQLREDKGITVMGRIAWCKYDERLRAYEAGVELLGLTEDQLGKLLLLITEDAWNTDAPMGPGRIALSEHMVVEYRRAGLFGLRWRPASSDEIALRQLVVVTAKPLPLKSRLHLRLFLPDGRREPIPCKGMVLRQRPDQKPNRAQVDWDNVVEIRDMAWDNRLRLVAFLSQRIMG
jgi:hypothetical protein